MSQKTSSNLQMHLVNSPGQEVLSEDFGMVADHFSGNMNVSAFPIGIYLIEIIGDHESVTKKVAIEH
ncbi:MAG: T9SS type A sorting domain-containing protein [Chitinophagales bacterium]